jgi:hypothetical protein
MTTAAAQAKEEGTLLLLPSPPSSIDFARLAEDESDDDDKIIKPFNIHQAAKKLYMAELWLLHALDVPDEPTRIFGSFRSIARCFPLFYAAYSNTNDLAANDSAVYKERFAAASSSSSSTTARLPTGLFELSLMTQAERHALKLQLHEDVKAIALASLEETTKTPKLFDGAPLPTEPTECMQRVKALIHTTEERLSGLRKTLSHLERMAEDAAASTRVLNGSQVGLSGMCRALEPIEAEALTARFTELPPPTEYEKKMTTMVTMMMTKKDEDEDEQKQNNHKRAKTSSSSGLCSACQC